MIFISDMDGTLLDDDSFISDYSFKKLEKLIEDGANFTISTGRDFMFLKRGIKDLKLNLPVIECNGSYITDYNTGKKLVINNMINDNIKEIYEIIEQSSLPVVSRVYTQETDKVYFSEKNMTEFTLGYYKYRSNHDPNTEIVSDIYEKTKDEKIMAIISVGRKDDMISLAQKLEVFSDKYEIFYTGGHVNDNYSVNISSKKANKGEAVKELMKLIDKDYKTICFGDNRNDIKMLQMADVSVCPKNAEEEVRKICDIIIDENSKDSVVKYMEGEYYGVKR